MSQLEATALVHLTEECCETGQIVQKIHRFGMAEYNGDDPNKTTNRELLEREVGHVLCMVEVLTHLGVLRPEKLAAGIRMKHEKLRKFSPLTKEDMPNPCTILLANPPEAQAPHASTMHAKMTRIDELCYGMGLRFSCGMEQHQAIVEFRHAGHPETCANFRAPYLEQALDLALERMEAEARKCL